MSTTDQPLQAVLDVMHLEQTGENEFRGHSLPQLHGRVYGGQVLAQALLAAERTVEPGRLVHSLHGYFLRPGDLEEPITFAVERMRDGRSFSARRTHAIQSGRPILSMIASFQEDQPGLEHSQAMPPVPGPDELQSSVELFSSLDHPAAQFFHRHGAFDLRHVQGQMFTQPAVTRTDSQELWMRARSAMPSDQGLQRAILAYACDQVMLEPIMREHGFSWLTENASVASLDHAMWWHREVDLSEWLLYTQSTPSAQGGRGLGTARVFNQAGELIATIAQEGMIRVPQVG